MPSPRLYLRKDKADQNGNCPIMLLVTVQTRNIYHSTGEKVPELSWDDKAREVKRGYPNANLTNAKIYKLLNETKERFLRAEMDGEVITHTLAKSLLSGNYERNGGLFLDYAQKVIDGISNSGTTRRYKVELDELATYAPDLSFPDIKPEFLTRYQDYLLKEKGKSHNTAINAFKFIRMVFNHAKKRGVTKCYPFKDWEYPKYEQPQKGYLTLDEVDAIWDKVATDLAVAPEIRLVAVFFCLECFAGLRVSDWGKFTIERLVKTDDLIVRTTKTGVDVRLPLDLMPRLQRTIDYIAEHELTWCYSGEHANRMLKLVAPIAEVNKRLTTHVARHTFATIMLGVGLSREGVAAALGVTMRVVDTYAKFSPAKIRNELQRIGGGV